MPRVEALKVGDPADEDTDVGPVIDEDARERILEWIDEARPAARSSPAATRRRRADPPDGDRRPAAGREGLAARRSSARSSTVTRVDSLDEAIELANGTRFGLQAGIFTRDVDSALRAARELEFGGVTINEAPTFRADQMPYGGVKDSGNTREGPQYAVRELTEERLVVIQL